MSSIGIIALLLLVALVLYFVIGSVVRYHGGLHHFPEVLPHYQVWCRLCASLIFIFSCGMWRPNFAHERATSVTFATLPGRPDNYTSANQEFQLMPTYAEEDFDDRRATQPAVVMTY